MGEEALVDDISCQGEEDTFAQDDKTIFASKSKTQGATGDDME